MSQQGQGWRNQTNAGDYFNQQQKQTHMNNRRPVIRRASDLVGPGIATNAVRITDFNDVLATFNGFFAADEGALGAPEATGAFALFVASDAELGGVQLATRLTTDVQYTRVFIRNPADETSLTWSGWLPIGGGLDDAGIAALLADDVTPSDTRAALDAILAASAVRIPGSKSIAIINPVADSTTIHLEGIELSGVGSSSVPSVAATPASGNQHTSSKRVDLLRTSAATNNLVGMRGSRKYLWLGDASGLGGFRVVTRFGPATGQTIASRLWVGLDDDISAGTDNEPSAMACSMLGVGYDAADTQLYIMTNTLANVTATKIATGLTRSSTDRSKVYTLIIEAAPNSSSVTITVVDEATGTSFSHVCTTNLPANTVFMAPKWRASTGAVSSVIGIAVMGYYSEANF